MLGRLLKWRREPPETSVNLLFYSSSGQVWTLRTSDRCTVRDVRKRLETPPATEIGVLLHGTRQLHDHDRLYACGLTNGAELNVLMVAVPTIYFFRHQNSSLPQTIHLAQESGDLPQATMHIG